MATVWLARDEKHGRPVALKVLRPELAAALGPDRFLREITLTAGLDHPHILPLLDSGEAAGQLYYTMPFVEGESLRERLVREKQLPVDEALRITREAADALEYAHSRGVVHRDIKPENILLAGGHARVADFGIATALTAAGGDRLTETGIAVGTPAYMSPEQATGERAVDGRSDQYSLATVLYEMLVGDPPFTGSNPQAVLIRKSLDKAPRLRTVRDVVPEAVEDAILRALSRSPADRFRTPGHLVAALDATAATARPLGERIARAARVVARPSVKRVVVFLAIAAPVAGIAVVLLQPARSACPRGVHARACDAYQRGMLLVGQFNPQSIDRGIRLLELAVATDSTFARAYAGLARGYAASGIGHGDLTGEEAFPKARRAATRALQLDDGLADAHLALAIVRYHYDLDWEAAEREFRRAVQLDPGSGWAHAGLGAFLKSRRLGEALSNLARARELDPLSPIIAGDLGLAQWSAGQSDLALTTIQQSLGLDPDFSPNLWALGVVLLEQDRRAEAIAAHERAAALNHAFTPHLAVTLALTGDTARARALLKSYTRRSVTDLFFIAEVHAAIGDTDEAFRLLEVAVRDRAQFVDLLAITPGFKHLHGDPRFRQMLAQMRLPDLAELRAGVATAPRR